jgi:hypothetical protein
MQHSSICTRTIIFTSSRDQAAALPVLVPRLATKPQMLSELWHQCLVHPWPTHLSLLVHHITYLPSKLTAGLHSMHSFRAGNDGKIKHAPMGETSDTFKLLPGTRFHLEFGFIRVSSLDVGVTAGHRIFTSYDGKKYFPSYSFV